MTHDEHETRITAKSRFTFTISCTCGWRSRARTRDAATALGWAHKLAPSLRITRKDTP